MSLNSDKTFYLETPDSSQVKKLIHDWYKQWPQGGIFALVAEQDSNAVEGLHKHANEASCPLVGAVFPELIINGELKKQGILFLRFDEMPPHCIVPISNTTISAGYENNITASLDLEKEDQGHSLFMIFDGMIPNIASIIDETYLQIGDAVHYMGVNAGSETFQPINCLFDNNTFTDNAVLVMTLNHHNGAFLEHSYTKPDVSISATTSAGNHISSMDWRPAFDVYKELASIHYGIEIDNENFYQNAAHFPLGIIRMDGEMLVRIPVGLEEDGSIWCVGEIPENSVLTLLQAIPPGSEETVESLVKEMKDRPEDTILNFYCAGRRMHLGDSSLNELAGLNNKLDNKTIVGALSLGEIGGAKQGGYPLFHNAAIVTIPWK